MFCCMQINGTKCSAVLRFSYLISIFAKILQTNYLILLNKVQSN